MPGQSEPNPGNRYNRKDSRKKWVLIVSAVAAVCFLFTGVLVLKMLLKDDDHKRRRQIQNVTLLKPPPPPKIKEKPPEPEIKKKEEIIEPEPEETPPDDMDEGEDDTPPGEDLGLDADGTAGSDGFGLKAKKGGRALIGSYGTASLLRKYAWYINTLQDKIRKKVKEHMEGNGGVPSGNFKTYVKITLSRQGDIVDYDLYGSSGNHKMDLAVEESLKRVRLDEPPPEGMPATMKIKITSKG